MSDTKLHIKNISDGSAVAKAVGGLYVNSFTPPDKPFCKQMLKKDPDIQHNFTMLCFEWFSSLARSEYYDDRNAAAVRYARSLSTILDRGNFKRRRLSKQGIRAYMDFNYRDDESAAELMEGYLRLSDDNDKFISTMLYEHKTNQQSFSRLCCRWFRTLADTDIKGRYAGLARLAAEKYTGFPMI